MSNTWRPISRIRNHGPTPVWSKYIVAISGANVTVNGASPVALGAILPTQAVTLYTAAARTVFQAIFLNVLTAFSVTGTAVDIRATLGTTAAADVLMMTAGDTFDLTQTIAFYEAGGVKAVSLAAVAIALSITTIAHTPSQLATGSVEVLVLSGVLP